MINALARASDLKTNRLHREYEIGIGTPAARCTINEWSFDDHHHHPPHDHIYKLMFSEVSQPIFFKLGHIIDMTWAGVIGGLKFSRRHDVMTS